MSVKTMIMVISILVSGFLIELLKYIKIKSDIKFLKQFEETLLSVSVSFAKRDLTRLSMNIRVLAKNMVRYNETMKRYLSTETRDDILETVIFNYLRFYNSCSGFNRVDFVYWTISLNLNTVAEIGSKEEEFKNKLPLLNPLTYFHNVFKLIVDILLSVSPNLSKNWIRNLVTLMAELVGIMSFLQSAYPNFVVESLNVIEKLIHKLF